VLNGFIEMREKPIGDVLAFVRACGVALSRGA